MKNNLLFIGIFATLFYTSCNSSDFTELSEEKNGIRFTVSDFEFEIPSRTVANITEQAVQFTWAANDTIGIFPDVDASQARFVMTSGAGTNSATFDGGGWALRADSKYASYYPFIADVNLDKTNIPVTYVGQSQTNNDNTSHLGKYDFMAATAIVPSDGKVSFNFKHLGCLIQFKLTMPKAGDYTSITLTSNDNVFATNGVYNLMSDVISISQSVLQDSITLMLDNVETTHSTPQIIAYMMFPPMDLSGHVVSVIVRNGTEICGEGTVSMKNFVAGTAYSLTSTLTKQEEQPKEGVTEVITAGTLDDLLGESKYQLSKLIIKGKINGDDIAVIRRMCGGYRDTTDVEFGILKELDLSQASIVTGGSYYMDNGDTKYRVKNANQINSCMFFGCSTLENIILPDNITSIEEAAMSTCSNLISVVIPSGVTSIGVAAFNACKSLNAIDLPQGLTYLGSDVFHSCQSLQQIIIPSGVQSIAANSFGHCNSLTDITLSDGLESIGNAVFAACDNLVSIKIPNTVTEMGERAFASCSKLKNVTLSSGQKQLNSYTFENCTALETIVIPEGMESIHSRAFQYCPNIIDITFPSSLRSIGDRAFYAAAAHLPITVTCYATNPPTLGSSVWKGDNNASASKLYVTSGYANSYKSSTWSSYFGQITEIE